jgi:hypothetical protein
MSASGKQGKLTLSLSRQTAIRPILRRFIPTTPIQILADFLEGEGLGYEAKWLLQHPAWLSNFWKSPTPKELADRRMADQEQQEREAVERARRAEEEAVRAEEEAVNHRAFIRLRAKDTDPACPYRTIRAALDAGFHIIKADEYGGEQWKIKGRFLVRNAEKALSRTAWAKRGRMVAPDAEPHGVKGFHPGRYVRYDVYRTDQTQPTALPMTAYSQKEGS